MSHQVIFRFLKCSKISFTKLEHVPESLGELPKHRLLGLRPCPSSLGTGLGQRIYIFDQVPGDYHAAR
ncbi:hypothetical protein I79_012942 [Cricetulus griseus]|uniref:Uncharacterized protein n=1 Tax=Cricetulus griseus TaxID=10029 RepID=G3HQ48_CRIGR|nr:hypothetical protein I79_012942 [Cricetulus griseus]